MQPLIHVKIDQVGRKNRILPLFLAIFFMCTAFSSPLLAVPHNSKPAAIDKLMSHYRGLGDFNSDFTQTKNLTAIGMNLKGKGQLNVFGAKGVVWKVTEPAPLEVKIDSDSIEVTTVVAGKEQKQSYSLKEGVAGNQIAASVKPFLDLFSGSTESLHERFAVEPTAEGFTLTPKDLQLPIKKLDLVPDASGQFLARVVIHEKSGDSIEYQFNKPVALVQK